MKSADIIQCTISTLLVRANTKMTQARQKQEKLLCEFVDQFFSNKRNLPLLTLFCDGAITQIFYALIW